MRWCWVVLLIAFVLAAGAQEAPKAEADKKEDKFTELIKGAEKQEGLFTLYRKPDKVFLEVTPEQLGKIFLCGITLEKGIGERGIYSASMLQEFVFILRRHQDRLQIVQRNVLFRVNEKHPWHKVLERSFSDSVLTSAKIEAEHPERKSLLVDLSSLLVTDLPGLTEWLNGVFGGGYRLDRDGSQVAFTKVFPKNLEVGVNYHFVTDRSTNSATLPDPRSLLLQLRYSFVELSPNGYRPRLADPRVGYFVVAFKDFTDDSRRTAFVRYICRWHLEKRDPNAPLSPPVKPIVFWIENTTPPEYRQAIKEGVEMWNAAFQQAGFVNAVEARFMPDDADWDPADIRYNTIRWILTHDSSFAVGPSRVNPLTGEILDADIAIEANFLRYVKREWRLLVSPAASRLKLLPDPYDVLDEFGWQPPREGFHFPSSHRQLAFCDYGIRLAQQGALGSVAFWLQSSRPVPEEPPKEYVHAFLRELVAHEVGHTLGLRHNFRASSMLSPEALHNPELTKRVGLAGSVMDYLPVNLAPLGVQQGEYWMSCVGLYDRWAIEYGYRPVPEAKSPEEELPVLRQIASRAPQPELGYGTDEDTWGVGFDCDPTIVRWDLGSDPMGWAQGQMRLLQELIGKLERKFPRQGEGYYELRDAFSLLIGEYGYKAFLISRYIGGCYLHRDFPDDPKGRPPFVPVPAALQRQALALLEQYLFAPNALPLSGSLLNKLGLERWWHWGMDLTLERPDYPIHERILQIQRRVLNRLFHPIVLARLVDMELQGKNSFRLSELFERLSKSIWTEVMGPSPRPINSLRRNLQRAHLQILLQLLLQPPYGTPEDARTLARFELERLRKQLQKGLSLLTETTSKAHLQETLVRIDRALRASVQVPM